MIKLKKLILVAFSKVEVSYYVVGTTDFVSYFTFGSCLFTIIGFKLVKYADCVLSEEMVMSGRIEDINKLKIQPKDIFVASFPKSGTTWLQQVVYLLLADTENSDEGNYYAMLPTLVVILDW